MDQPMNSASIFVLAIMSDVHSERVVRAQGVIDRTVVRMGPNAEASDVWLVAQNDMTPDERDAFITEAVQRRIASRMYRDAYLHHDMAGEPRS